MDNYTSTTEVPLPHHELTDYIEICLLSIIVTAGIVVNILALKRLMAEMKDRSRRRQSVEASFRLIKLHITIVIIRSGEEANIFLLVGPAAWHLGWLIVYKWLLGEMVCRLAHFVFMWSTHVCSHLVALLALHRAVVRQSLRRRSLRALSSVGGVAGGSSGNTAVDSSEMVVWTRTCLLLCWLFAASTAVLQPFVRLDKMGVIIARVTYELRTDWHQCTTLYQVRPADAPISAATYELLHLALGFWLPLFIICGAYLFILCHMANMNRRAARVWDCPQDAEIRFGSFARVHGGRAVGANADGIEKD